MTNSIVINASSSTLNTTNQGLYINPVREDIANTTYSVYYDEETHELTYTVSAAGVLEQNLQSANGDYTLALTDIGKHIYKTGTGAVLVPTNASVEFPVGTTITLVTGSSHSTTVQSANSGVTTLILSKFGADASINIPADTYVTILKVETDKWMVQN